MDKTLYSALHDDQTENGTTSNSILPVARDPNSFAAFADNNKSIIGVDLRNSAMTLMAENNTGKTAKSGNTLIEADDDDDEEDISSPEPEEMCPLVRPSTNYQRHPHLQQTTPNSSQINNAMLRNNLSLPLRSATATSSANNFTTSANNEEKILATNETYHVKLPFPPSATSQSGYLRQTNVGIIPRYENFGNNVGNSIFLNKGSSNGGKVVNPMVMIGLNNDDDQYSSSSPFHSATEDFGMDNDNERDRDPLIKPPAKTGGFHHLLSGKGKSKYFSGGGGNVEGDDAAESNVATDASQKKRKCSVGIFLAAISCIFFATSALIVKISDLHPMELLGVRGLLQSIFVIPLVVSTKNSFLGPKGSRSLLLSRAVLGAVALVMSFASIHLIPLADAATVIFTSPVFVSIFACLCLGEVCTWFDVAMIALTLLGVLLVSKPSFGFLSSGSWTSIVGTFCGLAAAMLTALAFIVLRQLKHVHYSVTVFWFSTVLASFGAVLTVALDGFALPTKWTNIAECIGIGVCGFLGQILLTKALQIENAGPVAVARTMDIVLAFFYQMTFLHDTPDWKSYLGSVLVVSCVLLTAFRRWYKDAKRSDKTVQNQLTNHQT